MLPTKDQAYQFALMMMTGVPVRDAIRYFIPEDDPILSEVLELERLGRRWATLKVVLVEVEKIQHGKWADLTSEQRIQVALDKHYNEMAYFLYSHNYADIAHQGEKAKADTCRMALEAKLAGMAGKMNALSNFWADLMGGKVKGGVVNVEQLGARAS